MKNFIERTWIIVLFAVVAMLFCGMTIEDAIVPVWLLEITNGIATVVEGLIENRA